MTIHQLAGKTAPKSALANIPRLVSADFIRRPDPSAAAQQVVFVTSGHRGSSLTNSFNQAPIGGLKVVTANGWFAARPSGTEAIYNIYADCFRGLAHLQSIQEEARAIVSDAFEAGGAV